MTDQSVSIRRLGVGDAAVLDDLNTCFAAAFDDPDTYAATRPGADYLERLLAKDHMIALTASAQGQVIGGLVAYVLEKFEQQRSEIYIFDLAVAAPFRRQGVSTALIERLRHVAQETGAGLIYVQSDPGDDPAVALYTKFGRGTDVVHFDIDP